jgi:hypothetical protein
MAPPGGFQTSMQQVPAVGVAGDFASANAWMSAVAGPSALVAGAAGVYVGRFCWTAPPPDPDDTNAIVNSFGAGNVAGFVHRAQQALITGFLQDASMLIPPGYQMGIMVQGDFWIVNSGTGEAVVGQKAYANFANGLATFAATGSPSTAASGSASSIAAETNSFTASISGDVMTVSAVGSGTLYPGTTISGTGVTTGNQIVSQISGTAGGVGTYLVSIPEQSVVSEAISGTYGLLTVGGTVVSGFAVGQTITGTNVVAGTQITALGTGTGGAGTYVVNNNTVVSSTAISAYGNVETKWYAASGGLPGELVKITSWVGSQG